MLKQGKMDLNMLKVTLKCQKYKLLHHFLEVYEYMNVGNGQN